MWYLLGVLVAIALLWGWGKTCEKWDREHRIIDPNSTEAKECARQIKAMRERLDRAEFERLRSYGAQSLQGRLNTLRRN